MSPSEEATGAEVTGPGERLRRARELQGLSVQQVGERLNLDVTVVEVLESDDFAALGAPVFAKGHLRHYSGLLGLSVEEVLDSYSKLSGKIVQPTLVPKSHGEFSPERQRARWPWVVGGLALFLIAAGVLAYVSEYGLRLPWAGTGPSPLVPTATVQPLESGGGANPSIAAAAGQPTAEGPVSEPAPGRSMPSAQVSAQADAASPGSDATTPAGAATPGQVSISLLFSADSWVEIYDASGQAVFYDLGRAGSNRSLAAAAPLSVTIGNASAVGLSINGQPVALPAVQPGETVARFKIEPDGSLQ